MGWELENGRVQASDGIVQELNHHVGDVLKFRRELARSTHVFERRLPETSCDCRGLKHASSLCLYCEQEARIFGGWIGIPLHGHA
jgi:hypothetical protein